MDTIIPAVTSLRQRMLEDMRIRKLELRTQEAYVRTVRKLAAYLHRPPDTARELLQVVPEPAASDSDAAASARPAAPFICRHCGQPMSILLVFMRGVAIRAPPP